jgi:hypothetical protein
MAEATVRQVVDEIERRANERGPEVLIRLLKRYDDYIPGCHKHASLRLIYTRQAIHHHQLNSRWKRGMGDWGQVNSAYYTLLEARRSYRDAVFYCGCSNKYDKPERTQAHG